MDKIYQVKWLNKAISNLDAEASYIAKDNTEAAQKVILKIYDIVNLLANNPAMGHPGRIHNTRELIVPDTPYLIPYRVNSKSKIIEILRVFHTSRKLPEKW